MLYSLWEFFQHGLDQFLAFRRISDCRLLLGWSWRDIALYEYFSAYFYESLLCRKRFLVESVFLILTRHRIVWICFWSMGVYEYSIPTYSVLFSRGIEWSTVRVGLKTTLGLWFWRRRLDCDLVVSRLKTWNMSVPRELPETNRF